MTNKKNSASVATTTTQKATQKPKNAFNEFMKAFQQYNTSLLYVAYWFGKLADVDQQKARDVFKASGWDTSKVSRVTSLAEYLTETTDASGKLVIGSVYGPKVAVNYTLIAEMKGKPKEAILSMLDEMPEGAKINTVSDFRTAWKKYDGRLGLEDSQQRKAQSAKNGAQKTAQSAHDSENVSVANDPVDTGISVDPSVVVRTQNNQSVQEDFKQMQALIEWSVRFKVNSKAFMEMLRIMEIEPIYNRYMTAIAQAEAQKEKDLALQAERQKATQKPTEAPKKATQAKKPTEAPKKATEAPKKATQAKKPTEATKKPTEATK